jgi:hypothetical protein
MLGPVGTRDFCFGFFELQGRLGLCKASLGTGLGELIVGRIEAN